MSIGKVLPSHLSRKAIIYARQSTMKQLNDHKESTMRQYGLRSRAIDCGWEENKIICIDEDLGQSGASADWRHGFQQLTNDVAHGRVGAIFALEVSRLARSSADWHRLLELCVLADVLIIDEQAVFTPKDYNDLLLLGLKGTMSEAELYWMKLRLQGGALSKARRGELRYTPPAGYLWDSFSNRFYKDPDEEVQRAVELVFKRFSIDRSAYGVTRYLGRMGVKLPSRDSKTKELLWILPRITQVSKMLHNPIYTGTYVYGRREERVGLVDGKIKKRKVTNLAQESWKSVIHDQHPAYISWDEFLANEKKMRENMPHKFYGENRGAAREGTALLQGLALCGRCGRRMTVRYQHSSTRRPQYYCRLNAPAEKSLCWDVSGEEIDRAVEKVFLDAITDSKIDFAFSVAKEVEQQATEVNQQWKLQKERLEYAVRLAERRYKAIDPDNRIVARTLEREWEEALADLEQTEEEYQKTQKSKKLILTKKDQQKLLTLSKDLRAVWKSDKTNYAERKNLLRIVIRDITLTPVDLPTRATRVQIWWQSGSVCDFSVPRKDRYTALATPPSVVETIRNLFEKGDDDRKIATYLTNSKIPRRNKNQWDPEAVRRVRYSYGIHYPDSKRSRRNLAVREDGLYSVRGVAEKLQVKPALVLNWANTGLLPVVAGGKSTKALWFRLDEEIIKKLLDAKLKRYSKSENQNSH